MARNRKKMLLVTVAVCIVILLAVGTTLAFMTDSNSLLNILNIGGAGSAGGEADQSIKVRIEEPDFTTSIAEQTKDENGNIIGGKLYHLEPGQKIMKDPRIVLVGKEDVYLRIKFTDGEDNVMSWEQVTSTYGCQLDAFWYEYGDNYVYLSVPVNKKTLLQNSGQNVNTPIKPGHINIFKIKTGANSPVPPNPKDPDTTKDIYTVAGKYTLQVSEKLTNIDLENNKDLSIIVEAVQARNFNYTPGWTNLEGQEIEINTNYTP